MLPFEAIQPSHAALFHQIADQEDCRTTEQSFVGLYIWSHRSKLALCRWGDFLFFRAMWKKKPFYLMPIGRGDLAAALDLLEEDAAAQDAPFVMHGLTQSMKDRVERIFPGRYVFSEDRDQADYLYESKALIELSGKAYHSKRNFITRFENEYAGRFAYEDITKENLDDLWEFQDRWCHKNNCADSLTLQEEATTIALLLYNLELLGAYGGLLRVDGRVVAFTAGSQIGRDTMDIHIEKADHDVVGAYPMINRSFARRHCQSLAFINREEDMGLEGLRRAKLSYHPLEICLKYTARRADHV